MSVLSIVRNRKYASLGLIVAAILFASCAQPVAPVAQPAAPVEQPTAAPAAQDATTPRQGGTLTVALPDEIGSMDVQGGIGIVAHPLFAINEQLYKFSPDMQLEPMLAESFELVDDTTYRYKLREGITFHTGNPFNAEAVKASFDRFAVPGVAARPYSILDMIESVEVEDEYTVLFHLNKPFPAFPFHLAHITSQIVDAKNANEVGDAAFSEKPSGTGPYVIEEWVKNDHMTLARNPNYWQEGKPYLDKIIYKVIPDEATRSLALERGEVDIVIGVGPNDVKRLKEDPNIAIDEATIARTVYLGFPYATGPFADPLVRQAIGHAVNTDAIVEFAQENTVNKATTFYAPFIFGSAEGKLKEPLTFDPEKAKSLLEEAGWTPGADGIREKDGQRLSMTLTFPTAVLPAMRPTAEIIQENLKEVGIELKLDPREWAAFVGDWFEKKVEMYMMGISANTGSPEFVFPNQWVTDGPWNAGQYANPEVDAAYATASTTIDEAARRQLYEELQQTLINDVPAVPLFHMKIFVAMDKKLHGFENHPLEHPWMTDTWLEQ